MSPGYAFEYDGGEMRVVAHNGVSWLLLDREVYYDGESAGYARILMSLEHIGSVLNRILRTGLLAFIPCLILCR